MIDLTFINNKMKEKLGIIFIVLCIFVRCITPYYIESYMFLLLIPSIGLIIKRDYIKNSHLMPIITLFIIFFVICTSLNGLLNPTGTLSNLYFNGVLKVVPGVDDVFTCCISNLVVIILALLHLCCGVLYYIPTTTKNI